MRTWTTPFCLAVFVGVAIEVVAQSATEPKTDANLPAPGMRGNADNVKYLDAKKDPSGNAIRLAKATGHVSNYDESKVGDYTLPDPLKMNDGRPVTSAEMWFKERRPEILKFYQTEIYGRIPENAPKVTWEVTETDDKAHDGTAIMKHLVGRIGDKPDAPKMNMKVYLPANATEPVPILLAINFDFGAGRRGPVPAARRRRDGECCATSGRSRKRRIKPAETLPPSPPVRPRQRRRDGWRSAPPRLGLCDAHLHRHSTRPCKFVVARRNRPDVERRANATRAR